MGNNWSLKPNKEILGYLGCEDADNSTEKAELKDNRWALEPSKDVVAYLNGENAKMPEPIHIESYLKAFMEWNDRKNELWVGGGTDIDGAYELVGVCGPLPKTEMEIQGLLDVIPEEGTSGSGIFISYLVNEAYPRDEIELRTDRQIGFLGTYNSGKKWVITGNVGQGTGSEMSAGEILVRGSSDCHLGLRMKGGKIIVEGRAGALVGTGMKSGEIHINGSYESIGYHIEGGNIYCKGKQIYENGRPVEIGGRQFA